MNVQLKLFAMARQAAGNDAIELELNDGATVRELRMELVNCLPELRPLAEYLRFAVNAQYAHDSTVISAADELACIPPVSGG